MSHLSLEDVTAYLDGDMSSGNIRKLSKHLDECDKCSAKIKDYASINIILELMTEGVQRHMEKDIFGKCPTPGKIMDYVGNILPVNEKENIEQHLHECADCREEVEAIRVVESAPEGKVPEIKYPERFLPKILRYVELYYLAAEKERNDLKRKSEKVPILETIRKLFFPRQPVLVPMGFADLTKRDRRFYATLDDAQLMDACKNLDSIAWEELEKRFRGYAYTIIRERSLGEIWEDIWQETLLALRKSICRYKEEGKARYYIRGIIYNRTETARRKKIRSDKYIERIDEKLLDEITADDPRNLGQLSYELKHVLANIKKLPAEFSSVLMALIARMTDKEMAKALNIKIETVRSRKFRARARLCEMKMKEQDFMDTVKRFFQNESFIKSLLHS